MIRAAVRRRRFSKALFKSFERTASRSVPYSARHTFGSRQPQNGFARKRNDKDVILEAFKVGDNINANREVIDGSDDEAERQKTETASPVRRRTDEDIDDGMPGIGGVF